MAIAIKTIIFVKKNKTILPVLLPLLFPSETHVVQSPLKNHTVAIRPIIEITTLQKKIDDFDLFSEVSPDVAVAVPAPAKASGRAKHAPQKSSLLLHFHLFVFS